MDTTTQALALPGIVAVELPRPVVVSPWPAPCAVKRSNVWPAPELSTSVRYMTAQFVAVADKHARRARRRNALIGAAAAGAVAASALATAFVIV